MRYLRICVCIILAGCFMLLADSVLSIPRDAAYSETRTVQAVKDMLPQVRQDFEHSQQRLELLANGTFGEKGALAGNNVYMSAPDDPNWLEYWNISVPAQQHIPFSDWQTIDWLDDEERDAIIFLASSQEIAHHFRQISNRSDSWNTLRADIHLSELRYASLIIFRGMSNISSDRLFHSEHLENDYYLHIYYGTSGASLIPLWEFLGRAFFVAAIAILGFGVLLPIWRRVRRMPS